MCCPQLLPARPAVLPAPQTCPLPTHLPFRISPGAGLRVTRYFPLSPEIVTFTLEGRLAVLRLLARRLLPSRASSLPTAPVAVGSPPWGLTPAPCKGIYFSLLTSFVFACDFEQSCCYSEGGIRFLILLWVPLPRRRSALHPCGKAGSALH